MLKTVPIDQIRADPKQPRKDFNFKYIKGLARNLKTEGMINPIEVDRDNMIITGECRWRAAKEAGWKKIPININGRSFTEYERLRHQMSENLHQSRSGGNSPMNPIDIARGYRRMLKLSGHKAATAYSSVTDTGAKELERELGIPRRTIHDYLSLLREPKYVLEEIRKGKPFSSFLEASRAPKEYREEIKRAVADGRITSKRVIRRFRALAKTRPDKAMIEFLRITRKQNEKANRILNRAIELSVALKNTDATMLIEEDKRMIRAQLASTMGSIRGFIGKIRKSSIVEEGEIIN